MGNAFWLVVVTPEWFFEVLIAPFSGVLTIVPTIGIVCLAVGGIWGAITRQTRLLAFAIPTLFSETFVAIAGLVRGKLADPSWLVLGFLIGQAVLGGYIANVVAKKTMAAWLLLVFSLVYALWTSFVSSMAFQDSWL